MDLKNLGDYVHHIEISIEEYMLIVEAMIFFQAHDFPRQEMRGFTNSFSNERLQQIDRSLGEKMRAWMQDFCAKYHIACEGLGITEWKQ